MNQASIFTLDKNSKGYKDFEKLPTDVYVDTSAWMCAYGSQNQNSKRGMDITDFMSDLLANGGKMYHSELVIQEAIHSNRRSILNDTINTGKVNVRRFNDGRVDYKKLSESICFEYPDINEEIKRSNNNMIEFIYKLSIPLKYEINQESTAEFLKFMDSFDGIIDTQDAKHILIARAYGINNFLTADGDFSYLDNDNIYIPSNEKYKKYKFDGRANVSLKFNENEY